MRYRKFEGLFNEVSPDKWVAAYHGWQIVVGSDGNGAYSVQCERHAGKRLEEVYKATFKDRKTAIQWAQAVVRA